MQITTDRIMRRDQKAILIKEFPDYDAKRHDAFVFRYNRIRQERLLDDFLASKGIVKK